MHGKLSFLRLGFGAWLILFIQFIAFFTFFMFVPFISTYFSEQVGFSVAFVGVILAVRIISQQGLMVAGGFLADRLGYKRVAILGFLLRGFGFAGMGLTINPFLIIVSAILSGFGGAMFAPALRASISSMIPPEKHKEAFSLMNMVENAGTVLGPLAGLYFKEDQFLLLCILSGAFFWVLGLVAFVLPNPPLTKKSSSWLEETANIFKNRLFLFITASMMPFHFIYQQLYLSLPIAAKQFTGSSVWIFSFVTILIILFQWPVSRFTYDKSMKHITILSYAVLGVSMIIISTRTNVWSLISVLAAISFGSMMLLPSFQSYVAKAAPKESLAAYFGFSNMAMAVGGSIGNLVGGMLYTYFVSIKRPEFFWLMLMLLSVLPVWAVISWRAAEPFQNEYRRD